MKVRLKQPVVEARQWDGDLDRMKEWAAANLDKSYQCSIHPGHQDRLMLTFSRYTFSLALGDWLVVSGEDSAQKVRKDEFEEKFEPAYLHGSKPKCKHEIQRPDNRCVKCGMTRAAIEDQLPF